MKHLFLINPYAGKADRSREISRQAQALCQSLGEPCQIILSEFPGALAQAARQAGQSGQETRLYACGGDGTFNEVVNGAYGFPNLSVTCFPCGSGNDFVKQYDNPAPCFDLSRFARVQERIMDLIQVDDRLAVNICSVGFDARIGTSIDAYRRNPLLSGNRAYQASVVVNLLKGVAKPCRVELEGGVVVDGTLTLACVCNGSWYGGSYHPVPEANIFDGVLDVLTVKKVSRLTVAKVIGIYQRGGYAQLPELISHYRTRSLRILTPKEEPVNVDGELMMRRDLSIEILPGAMRLFAPEGTWNT